MSKTPTKEMIEAVAWSASSQPGMPFGMILTDKDIENILTIGLANAPDALQSATEAPPPSTHLVAVTDAMVAAGRKAYSTAVGCDDNPHVLDGWIEDALRPVIEAALAATATEGSDNG